jgi:hypothetical protein
MQSQVSITSSQIALLSQFEIKSPQELIDDIAVNNKAKIKKLEERQESQIENIKYRIQQIKNEE